MVFLIPTTHQTLIPFITEKNWIDGYIDTCHVKREGSTERNMLQFCNFPREHEKEKKAKSTDNSGKAFSAKHFPTVSGRLVLLEMWHSLHTARFWMTH